MTNEPNASDTDAPVTCTVDGPVATITIDDGKANALSHAVLGGIEDALDQVEQEGARAVVVLGRDGKFSAGFDLSVMTSGPAQAKELLGRGAELGARLYGFPAPVVFGVTGHALAMGGILLCCADVRVGASGPFKLGLPEVRIGMPVPGFAVELCRDRVAPNWFTRAVHLGESLNPEQALEAGLLDELVELDSVRPRAAAVAAELAEAVGATPFRLTRQTVRGERLELLERVLERDLAEFFVEPR
jgi:enoyl-CoA hydratase